jgi:hypothetical protein
MPTWPDGAKCPFCKLPDGSFKLSAADGSFKLSATVNFNGAFGYAKYLLRHKDAMCAHAGTTNKSVSLEQITAVTSVAFAELVDAFGAKKLAVAASPEGRAASAARAAKRGAAGRAAAASHAPVAAGGSGGGGGGEPPRAPADMARRAATAAGAGGAVGSTAGGGGGASGLPTALRVARLRQQMDSLVRAEGSFASRGEAQLAEFGLARSPGGGGGGGEPRRAPVDMVREMLLLSRMQSGDDPANQQREGGAAAAAAGASGVGGGAFSAPLFGFLGV